jgi:hypothetical protein
MHTSTDFVWRIVFYVSNIVEVGAYFDNMPFLKVLPQQESVIVEIVYTNLYTPI